MHASSDVGPLAREVLGWSSIRPPRWHGGYFSCGEATVQGGPEWWRSLRLELVYERRSCKSWAFDLGPAEPLHIAHPGTPTTIRCLNSAPLSHRSGYGPRDGLTRWGRAEASLSPRGRSRPEDSAVARSCSCSATMASNTWRAIGAVANIPASLRCHGAAIHRVGSAAIR